MRLGGIERLLDVGIILLQCVHIFLKSVYFRKGCLDFYRIVHYFILCLPLLLLGIRLSGHGVLNSKRSKGFGNTSVSVVSQQTIHHFEIPSLSVGSKTLSYAGQEFQISKICKLKLFEANHFHFLGLILFLD